MVGKYELLYLNQEDLISAGLMDYNSSLKEVEKALVWHASKKSLSDKIALELDPITDWKVNSLAAIDGNYAANKWLGSNLTNKDMNLPRSIAIITLNDKRSGKPLCVMDGTLISAVRTGPYAGIGLKYLANERNNLGIIGSGVMAKSAYISIMQTFPERIQDVFLYSRNPENAHSFARDMGRRSNKEINVVYSIGDLVNNSDVTVSATTKNNDSKIRLESVKKGYTHIHIGGWGISEEVIVDVAKNGKIICDDWDLIKKRNAHPLPFAYNKNLIQNNDIHANIGEIIVGDKPGRTNQGENIHFDTVGIAEMDLVLAIALYEKSCEKGMGQKIELWKEPHWLLK